MYFGNDVNQLRLALDEFPSAFLSGKLSRLMLAAGKPDIGFQKALFEGYNESLQAAIQGIDAETAKLFKNNISRFAAVKAAQVHNKLVALKAKSKTDAEYKVNSAKLVKRYNSYTAIEYNTFVHRCRVAKQWAQFEKEAHLYPNIQWLKTRSATPDEVHRQYWGRIWPKNHPFWQENQPGCRYGCKCSWCSTDTAATENSDINIVPASPGLEGNPFYTGEVISEKHPYFTGIAPHVKNLGPLYNPDDIAYIKAKTAKGKEYLEHYLYRVDKGEFLGNRNYVDTLFDSGFKNVVLLPRIHANEVKLRERYYGAKFNKIQPTKCPDCYADGHLVEFKNATGVGKNLYKNLSNAVSDAASKSNIALVKLENKLSDDSIKNLVNGKFKQYKELEKAIIINVDVTLVITR